MFNHFNLSCDLMEPFRVLVDRIVYQMKPIEFGQEQKHELWKMLDQRVNIDGQEQVCNECNKNIYKEYSGCYK